MKIFNQFQVQVALAAGLPGSPAIWLPDPEYQIPTRAEVEELLNNTWFDQYAYRPAIRDCDKYALLLHAFVAQERARLGERLAWAFGEAWYRLVDDPEQGHALNLVITADQGVFCVEPQNDVMSRPDRDRHRYFFVRM